MKRLYALFLLSLLVYAAPALALPPQIDPRHPGPKPPNALATEVALGGHVTDPGARLSPFDRADLEKKLTEIQTELHADLPVYLVNDLQNRTLEEEVARAYREWKIGRGWDTAAILGISPDNQVLLYTGPGLPPPVGPDAAQDILHDFTPALSDFGLRGAIERTLDLVTQELRKVDGTKPRPAGKPNDKYKLHFDAALLAILFAVLWLSVRRIRSSAGAAAHGGDSSPRASSVVLDGVHRLLGWPHTRPAWFDVLCVTAIAFGVRAAWLGTPPDVHIFDESYYIQSARVILGLNVKVHNLPIGALSYLDPNREHPPLAKLLIALSMDLLGDNPWGQRFASVLFGTACVPVLYLIARRLGGSHGIGLMAAYLAAVDNLFFVHGRIACLDIFFVFFGLCAVLAYASGLLELAGVALAFSTNCKITGLFGFGVLITFEAGKAALQLLETRKLTLRPFLNLGILGAWYAGATLVLLGALDASWSRYPNPLDHLAYIIRFGKGLSHEWPQGIESAPWQWMINEVQIPYFVMNETKGDLSRAVIEFKGAMNPYVIFFAPVAMAYAAARALRKRDDLSLMALSMFVGTYAPYWYLWFSTHRISYIYYFVPTVPAVALLIGILMQRLQPRLVPIAYAVTVALGTWAYFPYIHLPN